MFSPSKLALTCRIYGQEAVTGRLLYYVLTRNISPTKSSPTGVRIITCYPICLTLGITLGCSHALQRNTSENGNRHQFNSLKMWQTKRPLAMLLNYLSISIDHILNRG